MAIYDKIVTGGIGINYTKEVDSSLDYSGITNDTYFKNLDDGLIYWKNSGGTVVSIFEEGGGSDTNFYVTGGTIISNTMYLDRNDTLSAATIDVSSLTGGTDTYLTGQTFTNDTLVSTLNDGSTATTVINTFTEVNTDILNFNTGYTGNTIVEGRMYWDEENQTVSLGLHDGDVSLQLGQELHYLIKNQSGATIENGRVVRATGTLGSSGRILGEYMIADGSIPPKFTLGIATENILNGDDGYVTEFGVVRGINTTGVPYGETWNNGDILWVSSTIPGGLTNVEPLSPNLHIEVAIVIDADANGSIFVRPHRYPYAHDIQDMGWSGGTENNLDVIQWDSALGYFKLTNTPNFNSLSATTISGGTYYGDGSNLTGIPDTNDYTTGTTLVGSTLYFDRTDTLSAYTANLAPLLDDTNFYTTGSTVIGDTAYFDRTDTLSAYTLDLSGFVSTTGDTMTGSLTLSYSNNIATIASSSITLLNSGAAKGVGIEDTTYSFFYENITSGFTSKLVFAEPSASRTLTLPNASGTVALLSDINDIYTTGTTLVGTTLYFDTTDSLSAYTADLSSLGGSGEPSDGDKGDITVSSTGTVWTIDANVVSNTKLRDSAALSVIGRSANSTGDPADIAAGTDGHVLRRSGTSLGFGTIATAGIANDAVSNTKLANMAQSTIKGRAAAAGTGDPTDLTATQVRTILNVADGAQPKPTLSKTFTLDAPTASDDVTIFRTDVAITVVEVIAVSVGTSPSTTYQLKHSTDRSAAGNNLTTSAASTSTTTGNVATLSDATIPANSWVWFESTAASGTNVVLSIDIRYTED